MKLVRLALVAVAAQGCTIFPDTPGAKLYALEVPMADSIGQCPLRFAVRDVKLPGYLDRPELVLALDNGRTEISSLQLWAAPLGQEITRLLGQGINERLQDSQLMPYPIRSAERPDWIVVPVITRFQLADARLAIDLSVTAFKTDGSTSPQAIGPFKSTHAVVVSRTFESGSAAATASAVAQAWGRNLQLQIDDSASALKSALCP